MPAYDGPTMTIPLEAVIFDRDGVLVDVNIQLAANLFPPELPLSLEELGRRWLAYGKRAGFPRSVAEERLFMRGLWDAIGDEFRLSPELRRQLYDVDYTRTLVAFPDARPALQLARQHGLKTAVLSNFAMASIDASLAAVDLAGLVDVAAAATVIGVAKPEPGAYQYVTTALGVAPAGCLFFDDKADHVAGARASGMQAFLVDRSRNRHCLEEYIVCDLSALPLLLRSGTEKSFLR